MPPALAVIIDLVAIAWTVLAVFFLRTVYLTYAREYKPHRRSLLLMLAAIYTIWSVCSFIDAHEGFASHHVVFLAHSPALPPSSPLSLHTPRSGLRASPRWC